jgi:hypothetical protein
MINSLFGRTGQAIREKNRNPLTESIIPLIMGAFYHHIGRVYNYTEIIILCGNIRKICE